ncbi:MAG: SURF1 family protein [Chloroflexi bacterium]|nr:MAG: SURF1 family protein [Chloroflexota bacterium]
MGAPGIHLIAPLRIEGSDRAVLVDRGWVPEAEAAPERWSQFDEPGTVVVTGFLRLSQPPPRGRAGGKAAASPSFQTGWYRVDIPALQAQTPYELLPVYILQAPADDDGTHLPYRSEPSFDLSDGPHLGYAIQWFLFALILGGGYLRYVSGKEQDVLENSTCNS